MSIRESERQYSQRPQPAAVGAVVLLAVCGVVLAVIAWAQVSWVAVALVAAYAVFAFVLTRAAHRSGKKAGRLPLTLLWTSVGAALAAGMVVFAWQWFPFHVAEWGIAGLYIAALATGLLRALTKLLGWLAALLALLMVAAIIVLPVPSGGEDLSDEATRWSVVVGTQDQDGAPLADAAVRCVVLLKWLGGPDPGALEAHQSEESGEAKAWEFTEDRRLKSVVCSAEKAADDGNAGYPLQLGEILAPHAGRNDLLIRLQENPHPDTAFLAVRLTVSPPYPWYYLDFEMWEGRPPRNVGFGTAAAGAPKLIATRSWYDLRGHGFRLTQDQAGKDLSLRYRYERPGSDSGDLVPPVADIITVAVGRVPVGSHSVVTIALPSP